MWPRDRAAEATAAGGTVETPFQKIQCNSAAREFSTLEEGIFRAARSSDSGE
jgi:hypothetical protein